MLQSTYLKTQAPHALCEYCLLVGIVPQLDPNRSDSATDIHSISYSLIPRFLSRYLSLFCAVLLPDISLFLVLNTLRPNCASLGHPQEVLLDLLRILSCLIFLPLVIN